jgi:hypothetical protein
MGRLNKLKQGVPNALAPAYVEDGRAGHDGLMIRALKVLHHCFPVHLLSKSPVPVGFGIDGY